MEKSKHTNLFQAIITFAPGSVVSASAAPTHLGFGKSQRRRRKNVKSDGKSQFRR
jgi:hypothetical protein